MAMATQYPSLPSQSKQARSRSEVVLAPKRLHALIRGWPSESTSLKVIFSQEILEENLIGHLRKGN
jgi:hypothetical protein